MTGLLDCPSCGARMALEPDTRFCNGCARTVTEDARTENPLGTQAAPVCEGSAVRRLPSRLVVLLIAACLAGCASRALASGSTAWILPLSAQDSEAVCVITMDYPGRKCTTVGDLRAFVRSVKAD